MISENIKQVREKIEQKCLEIDRNPSEITLIAVAKNFPPDYIKTAFAEGVTNFGENKAQELTAKFEHLSDLNEKIKWHFIGNLQRNKVRFAVQVSEYIHSVDSLLIASEINKRAAKINKNQKILLEIKTSDEETKSGLESESEIKDLLRYCTELPNIKLVGLMTIAPFTKDKNLIRKSFSYLRKLKDNLKFEVDSLNELSMGMTNDYEIAIEEGSTMIRIGSAIFGERDYSKNWMQQ